MNKIGKIVLPLVALAVLVGVVWWAREKKGSDLSTPSQSPPSQGGEKETVVAENLQIPWEVAFLPDGDMLVTERPGTLKRIGKDQKQYAIDGVRQEGEGGLLGLALHPNFSQNHFIYLYLTTAAGGGLTNRVERYGFENDALADRKVIIENIPGASYHDGGRIKFGPASAEASAGKPDYYLFITTGDAQNPASAQDKNSLAGKILRVRDDGTIPPDNPFGNAVYSYGHRNPQGLAWDDRGRLWATEHGRSGALSGLDELNLIEKGKNYGWPVIQGDEKRDGMETPVANSGPTTTWAPSGLAFKGGALYFGGLRGESIYKAKIVEGRNYISEIERLYNGQFGRVRAAVIGPDGNLYITTSNRDGRGNPQAGDDKVIRLRL